MVCTALDSIGLIVEVGIVQLLSIT